VISLRREAEGEAEGALVLFHGRGASEHDLYPLLDLLDPDRRLVGLTPRGPFQFDYMPGFHWYRLAGIPTPDPPTFSSTFAEVSAWLDELPFPAERIVLGGFSQGAVMTYALGLGEGRPTPTALVCLSGFLPQVPGFRLDLERTLPPMAIGHGTYDDVIPVEFSREAKDVLEAAGASVLYREAPMGHTIEPAFLPSVAALIRAATGG
jgi:phospholipase/carboxylesterase